VGKNAGVLEKIPGIIDAFTKEKPPSKEAAFQKTDHNSN
jgi:hypothetical protein